MSLPAIDKIDLKQSLQLKTGHEKADDTASRNDFPVRTIQSHRSVKRQPFMKSVNLKPALDQQPEKPGVNNKPQQTTISQNYKVTVSDMTRQHKKNTVEIYGEDGFPEGKMIENEHYNFRPRAFKYYRSDKTEDKTFIDEYK